MIPHLLYLLVLSKQWYLALLIHRTMLITIVTHVSHVCRALDTLLMVESSITDACTKTELLSTRFHNHCQFLGTHFVSVQALMSVCVQLDRGREHQQNIQHITS